MRQDQIEALDALEKANLRLEVARKELGEAITEQTRAHRKARTVCPRIFSSKKESDDE